MSASDIPIERWLEHKAEIHQCYIIEDKTLPQTMAFLREVHGFRARFVKYKSITKALAKGLSKSQYTTKLKAWGFKKYNRGDLYPRIEDSLKRRRIDIDSIESVMIRAPHEDKLIPYKQLKKALGRSNGSRRRSDSQGTVANRELRATLTAFGIKLMYHLPLDSRSSIELKTDILTLIFIAIHVSISLVNSPRYSRSSKTLEVRDRCCHRPAKAQSLFLLGRNLWR
jgi:hypothetical protein